MGVPLTLLDRSMPEQGEVIGSLITNNIEKYPWKGLDYKNQFVQNDVYIFRAEIYDIEGKSYVHVGKVVLIR